MTFKLGDRVVTPDGSVGIIEEIDMPDLGGYASVRLRTPDDEPSIVSSCCPVDRLKDGTNILPQPRSREWKRNAAEFTAHVTRAMKQHLGDKE